MQYGYGNGNGTRHPQYTSTTSRAISPELSCYLAFYSARVAHPVVRAVYEPLVIDVMHLVLILLILQEVND